MKVLMCTTADTSSSIETFCAEQAEAIATATIMVVSKKLPHRQTRPELKRWLSRMNVPRTERRVARLSSIPILRQSGDMHSRALCLNEMQVEGKAVRPQ
jgi:hypothetical protein